MTRRQSTLRRLHADLMTARTSGSRHLISLALFTSLLAGLYICLLAVLILLQTGQPSGL